MTAGRTSGEGDASDKLPPQLRDHRGVKVVRCQHGWIARGCLEGQLQTALQDAGDTFADISNVRRPSTEVLVVHAGEGVRVHGRRHANGFERAAALLGDRRERRLDESRIPGEHRLGFEDRRDFSPGSRLGLMGEPGELLRGTLEGGA